MTHDDFAACMHGLVDARPARFQELAPACSPHDDAALVAPIIPEQDTIDGQFEGIGDKLQVKVGQLIQDFLIKVGFGNGIHQGIFKPAQIPTALE